MFRALFTFCCFVLLVALFLSCGEEGYFDNDDSEERNRIEGVLYERWKEGYEKEDMGIYLSGAFP